MKRKKSIQLKNFKKEILYSTILLTIGLLVITTFNLKVKPNDQILQVSDTVLENVNPNFKIQFEEKESTQVVKFESKISDNNPFTNEQNSSNIISQVKEIFSIPKKTSLEMSIKEIAVSGTESETLKEFEEGMIQETELSKSHTPVVEKQELVEVGRILGELDDEQESSTSKSTVLTQNIVPGVDLEYQIIEGIGLKEEIVIKNMDEYYNTCGQGECKLPFNQFIFELKVEEGISLRKSLTSVRGTSNTYYFVDENEKYVAHFLPNFALDGIGAKTNEVDMSIEDIGSGIYDITVTLDIDWLLSNERVFPIRIDPSIVHDTTTEFDTGTYNRSEVVTGPKLQTSYQLATGGDSVYYSGDYVVHVFTSDGTFSNNGIESADIMVLAGGGGGGGSNGAGGGGGGGGLLYDTDIHLTTAVYPVTVGTGGAGTAPTAGSGARGGGSSFGTLMVATGGGGGGGYTTATTAPRTGGSGGGGGSSASGTVTGALGIPGQGFDGGNGRTTSTVSAQAGGGGGGASAVGVASTATAGGNGGAGLSVSITGSAVTYAGGGGGGKRSTGTAGTGGAGGGGNGGLAGAGTAGTDGLGGGGGGGSAGTWGGDGGDGIVVIRYKFSLVRYFSSEYISPELDLAGNYNVTSLSWTPSGLHTGDGETPYSTTGLVGQWDFNETSGTTADNEGSCGASCDGTLTNMTTTGQDAGVMSGWTAINRRWGAGALMFDGSDDYVSIPDNDALDFSTDLTLEAWIKPNEWDTNKRIITKPTNPHASPYDYYTLMLHSSNRILFGIDPGDSTRDDIYSETLEVGEWIHVVGTYDGTDMKLYIDGDLVNSASHPGSIPASTTNLFIGDSPYVADEIFNGIIDSVKVYNRALTAGEILSNYQSGNIEFQYRTSTDGSTWGSWSGGTETLLEDFESAGEDEILKDEYVTSLTPLAHYKLDDTNGDLAGSDIFDSSGNAYHGEINGTNLASGLVDGVLDYARDFNGTDDYINIGSSLEPTIPMTISMWIKPESISATVNSGLFNSDKTVFSAIRHTGIWFDIDTAGKLYLNYGSDTVCGSAGRRSKTGTTTITAGSWYHVVGVIRGATDMSLYINGLDDGGTYDGSGGALASVSRDGAIGTTTNCSTGALNPFNGIIDDVVIYNSGLTIAQVNEIYKNQYMDHTEYSITSSDLSASTMLPFWIASDEIGSNIQLTYGENDYVNNKVDANTEVAMDLDELVNNSCDGTTDTCDDSGNSYHGTVNGTTITEGKFGKSRTFDGANDYITMGDLAFMDTPSAFTVSLWFNRTTNNSGTSVDSSHLINNVLFSQSSATANDNLEFGTEGSNFEIYLDTAGTNLVGTDGGDIPAGIQNNIWYHVAVVYDSAQTYELKIYLNGVLIHQSDVPSGALADSSTSPFAFGIARAGSDNTGDYTGLIDNIRIDSVGRSANDIRHLYELERRIHPITIYFKADLQAGDLITGSGDLGFTISETAYGTTNAIENLVVGDKIVVTEIGELTEAMAQGYVDSINTSTGAVTVSSWEAGSTFPSSGFTVNAKVFKWQKEYVDIRKPLDADIDAVTEISFTRLDTVANFWVDDIYKAKYITDYTGTTFTEVQNIGYFQYKTIFTTHDRDPLQYLSAVQIDYEEGGPTLDQLMRHGKWFNSGTEQSFWWVD